MAHYINPHTDEVQTLEAWEAEFNGLGLEHLMVFNEWCTFSLNLVEVGQTAGNNWEAVDSSQQWLIDFYKEEEEG